MTPQDEWRQLSTHMDVVKLSTPLYAPRTWYYTLKAVWRLLMAPTTRTP
jgi:hypothetical protein